MLGLLIYALLWIALIGAGGWVFLDLRRAADEHDEHLQHWHRR